MKRRWMVEDDKGRTHQKGNQLKFLKARKRSEKKQRCDVSHQDTFAIKAERIRGSRVCVCVRVRVQLLACMLFDFD